MPLRRIACNSLEQELAGLEEESAGITNVWMAEKQKLGLAADLKKQLEDARNELAIAQRKGEFQKAGELAYGTIPIWSASWSNRKRRTARVRWSKRP